LGVEPLGNLGVYRGHLCDLALAILVPVDRPLGSGAASPATLDHRLAGHVLCGLQRFGQGFCCPIPRDLRLCPDRLCLEVDKRIVQVPVAALVAGILEDAFADTGNLAPRSGLNLHILSKVLAKEGNVVWVLGLNCIIVLLADQPFIQ